VAGTAAGTAAETVADTDVESADGAAAAAAGAEKLPPKRRFGIDAVGNQRAGLAGIFPGVASEDEDAPARASNGPGKLIKPNAVRGFVVGPSWGSFGAGLGWLCTLAGATTADPPCMPHICLCQFHEVSRGESAAATADPRVDRLAELGSLGSPGTQGNNRCVDVSGAATVLPNGDNTLRGVVVPDGDRPDGGDTL